MRKGVMITILVVIMILVFLALIAGYIYMQFTQEPYIPEQALLQIELGGEIVDSDNSVFSKKDSVRDLWLQLQRAKIDPRIRAVYLKLNYLQGGLAKLEDIGRMLTDFRKSGKKVYAFIENGGLKEYLLATFANEINVFRGGSLLLNGLAAEAFFLKETFSKLGIKAEFYHIGKYKTAANTFIQDHMTPAHREALQKLLDDIQEATLETIARNRDIDKEVIRQHIEAFNFSGQILLDNRMIDKLVYEDELLDELQKEYDLVDFYTYKDTTSPRPYVGYQKIAVIFASGEIHSGSSGGQSIFGGEVMGSKTVAAQIKRARKNPAVKAVVLRVDSPGGSPFASDAIRREAEICNKEKPLVVSMSDLAASGGYQISLSCSKILALPQTITGSIGVVGGKFVLKDLYKKIGLSKETVKTTTYADMFTDYREFSPAERKKYVGFMKYIYDTFVKKVAESRGMTVDEVEEIAQGRVWAGTTAIKLNLVDENGGLLDAIARAKELAGIPGEANVGMRIYPREKSLIEMITDTLGMQAQNPLAQVKSQLKPYARFFPALMSPCRIQIR